MLDRLPPEVTLEMMKIGNFSNADFLSLHRTNKELYHLTMETVTPTIDSVHIILLPSGSSRSNCIYNLNYYYEHIAAKSLYPFIDSPGISKNWILFDMKRIKQFLESVYMNHLMSSQIRSFTVELYEDDNDKIYTEDITGFHRYDSDVVKMLSSCSLYDRLNNCENFSVPLMLLPSDGNSCFMRQGIENFILTSTNIHESAYYRSFHEVKNHHFPSTRFSNGYRDYQYVKNHETQQHQLLKIGIEKLTHIIKALSQNLGMKSIGLNGFENYGNFLNILNIESTPELSELQNELSNSLIRLSRRFKTQGFQNVIGYDSIYKKSGSNNCDFISFMNFLHTSETCQDFRIEKISNYAIIQGSYIQRVVKDLSRMVCPNTCKEILFKRKDSQTEFDDNEIVYQVGDVKYRCWKDFGLRYSVTPDCCARRLKIMQLSELMDRMDM